MKKVFFATLSVAVISLTSCTTEEPEIIETPPQTTYAFARDGFSTVSYSGQTARLDMLEAMVDTIKSAVSNRNSIGLDLLENMYANTNNVFADTALNTSGKDLRSKTFSLDVELFDSYLENLATSSNSIGMEASNGQAGVLSTTDGAKSYLVDENGIEWLQVFEKGIMGATFYYQATSVYFSDDKIGEAVNNSDPVDPENGKYYTTMEHHWDEAFGYFGVPTNFLLSQSGVRFHGKYCNSRNELLGTNEKVMANFISGRIGITNNVPTAKNAAITEIRNGWELVIAGTAIHYLNGAIENFSSNALRCHELSEALAFVMSLKYNIGKTVSNATIDQWIADLGANFYEVQVADLSQLRNEMATAFNLEDIKEQL